MYRYSRRLAQLLTLAFLASIFAPFLLCGGGSLTQAEASDCCRAMQFKCHKSDGDGACCKHQTVAPLHLAITSPSELRPPQPLATLGLLPVAASGGLLGTQSPHQLFDLFSGHSPPETAPLFLLNSTLLI
ncbi:MAG: hypothetical protein DMG26_11530 [Acidobacteria bacterium]|nr:MAG: hypothetical protein DMG26_11530 [Acidobacteriota bacterium]